MQKKRGTARTDSDPDRVLLLRRLHVVLSPESSIRGCCRLLDDFGWKSWIEEVDLESIAPEVCRADGNRRRFLEDKTDGL